MTGPICIRCKGWPCVCAYLAKLQSGDMDQRILQRAASRMQVQHSYEMSCPCPFCYRSRVASWEVEA